MFRDSKSHITGAKFGVVAAALKKEAGHRSRGPAF
jgi:hypothetical protein